MAELVGTLEGMSLAAFEFAMKPSFAETYMKQARAIEKLVASPAFAQVQHRVRIFETSGLMRDFIRAASPDRASWMELAGLTAFVEANQFQKRMNLIGAMPGITQAKQAAERMSALLDQSGFKITYPNVALSGLVREYTTSLPGAAVAAETFLNDEVAEDASEDGGLSRLSLSKRLLIAATLNEAIRQLLVVLADALSNDEVRRAGNVLALVTALLLATAAIRDARQS